MERLLRRYQREIVDRQYQLGRVADAVIDLFASICVLRRLDAVLGRSDLPESQRKTEWEAGTTFLAMADRRIRHRLAATRRGDAQDAQRTRLADRILAGAENNGA